MSAAYGSAGEQCTAISVVVPVSEATANALRERLVAALADLRAGPAPKTASRWALVTKDHRDKAADYLGLGVEEGARLVADGHQTSFAGHDEPVRTIPAGRTSPDSQPIF
ncbi:aldehyde dehydrogenase family protein [Streptomyces sp. NPDC055092]